MMETLEWTTQDRTGWPAGPWDGEPDKMQWADEATGLPCLIHRGPLGALCGYVAVPASHPYYGKHNYDIEVDVHGGLTFADACDPDATDAVGIGHLPAPGEPDDVWWFGFDCADCDDIAPMYYQQTGLSPLSYPWPATYKTVVYVKGEISRLAEQLAAVQ